MKYWSPLRVENNSEQIHQPSCLTRGRVDFARLNRATIESGRQDETESNSGNGSGSGRGTGGGSADLVVILAVLTQCRMQKLG